VHKDPDPVPACLDLQLWWIRNFGKFHSLLMEFREISYFCEISQKSSYCKIVLILGFPVSHVFLVSRNTKLYEIHHQFHEISHVSRNKIFREISFRYVNSKISFRFAKFHLDSLRFATFHLVLYRFTKFRLVSFRFADIQTVSFHLVNILMRFLTV
jgi:hypothetical protein